MKISNFVDLVADAQRRDLTINSMAMDDNGNVVDPFDGQDDLKNGVLRHTSAAFEEDPVRVLRVARFRARLGPQWTVAPETVSLIASMAKRGVLNELTAERVWKELSRSLMEPHPRLFFDTLLESDALHVLFPEVYRLKTALESRKWHPEGDAYEHTMLVLTQAALLAPSNRLDIMLACLVHDFGKGLTPRHLLPKHYGHDVNGVPVVKEFCDRLSVPTKMRDAAMTATRYHMYGHKLRDMNPKTFVKMFDAMNAKNDPAKVFVLYWVFICDHRGRLGSENSDPSHLGYFLQIWKAYSSVRFADVFPNGETNVNKIRDGLFRARVQAVSAA